MAAMAASAASAQALRGGARMAAWRAHAYGGAHELRLEAARVPPLRAPDHVLVRVAATSINPLDVAMIGGYGSRILNTLRRAEGAVGAAGAAEGVEFPLVVGRDFVGRVERAGPAARLRRGARVWGVVPPHLPGAHADYVLVRDNWVDSAPDALDDASAGGALYAALSACAALRAAGLWPAGAGRAGPAGAGGGRVLLLGLGGVGHAALQLLVAAGARVVVGCAGEQVGRALALGADAALDRHAHGYDSLLEDSGPYEAIVDCAGLGGEAAGARRWRFARYVTLTTPLLRATDQLGLLPGAAQAAAALLAQSAGAARAAGVMGATGATSATSATSALGEWACPPHVRWAYFRPHAGDMRALRRLAEQGRFVVQVERVFPWWDARAAYERAGRGAARGKLLLDFAAPAPP